MAGFTYFKGINTLRFLAAFFVIISHANISLVKLGIYKSVPLAFLTRGEDAVDFFFTLSGFLITYLLLIEIQKKNTVSIKQFYLRRIFRIWPVYFLVVGAGFLIFTILYKQIYGTPYFTFSVGKGLMYFIFFLPNYMAVNYQVGLLYPLWSIGVEEQFYLFWAPLIKLFKKNLFLFLLLFAIISTTLFVLLQSRKIIFPENIQRFLLTQKFFAMAIGGLFAYLIYKKPEWYNKSFFAWKPVQLLVASIIAWHYLVGFSFSWMISFKIACSFLYGFLILNVSVVTNKLFDIDKPLLNYLGIISYGLYMYHMLVDYLLRTIVSKTASVYPRDLLIPLYYILLLAGTIVVAGVSYKYFESYFLRIKTKLHNI